MVVNWMADKNGGRNPLFVIQEIFWVPQTKNDLRIKRYRFGLNENGRTFSTTTGLAIIGENHAEDPGLRRRGE